MIEFLSQSSEATEALGKEWGANARPGTVFALSGPLGAGKTQLARAAAAELGRPLLSRVVNARMEPEDLLYRFDAVARLSEAQLRSHGDGNSAKGAMDPKGFLMPDVFW